MNGVTGTEPTPRHIDIADITHVQRGFVGTQKLERSSPKNVSSRPRPPNQIGSFFGSSENIVDNEAIISIVHRDQNTLDLLISNPSDRDDLLEALHQIRSTYHSAKLNVGREELLLRYIWYDIDVDRSGQIDLKEMGKILDRINLYQTSREEKKHYHEFVKSIQGSNGGGITFHDTVSFLRQQKLLCRSQTMEDEVWEQIFGKADTVTAEEFFNKFLQGTQKETDVNLDDAKSVFAHFNSMEISGVESGGSFDEMQTKMDRIRFAEYLHSSFNSCFNPDRLEFVESTLHKPLSHYWINTSHNTYLSGDQLQSNSSVEMYARSLQLGCRCLELDCWDSDSKIPVIYHGYTLTSKILFEDVINAVNCYIVDFPDCLPIILSLENHCSAECQEVMARVLSDVLGNKLYVPHPSELDEDLPTPHSLRGKVVIKGKRPPELEEMDEPAGEEQVDSGVGGENETNENEKKKVLPKVIPALARLTLLHGTKFKSFDQSLELAPSHMHSISEPKISKILEKDDQQALLWHEYNSRHMTRTYPAGSRVDSSNYSPIRAWSVGCQLVALNFQTPDAPLTINYGRFHENGGCGYVLKPDLSEEFQSPPDSPRILRVQVLSGSCLPKPQAKPKGECIDPYVKVTVHDALFSSEDAEGSFVSSASSSSEKKKSLSSSKVGKKTDYIQDNGYCPTWNGPVFEFPIHSPKVAMVQFTVKEKDDVSSDETIAEASIPANSLRSGFRSVQLFDRNNTRSGHYDFATLLVKVEFSE